MLNTLLKSIKKRDFPFYFSYVNVVTLGIWKPKTKVFLFKQQHNNSKTRALDLHFLFCNMEQFLRIVEEPSSSASTEVSIDADRLKFFNSKMKTWDYAKISADDFHKLHLTTDLQSSKIIIWICQQNILLVQVKCLYFVFELTLACF